MFKDRRIVTYENPDIDEAVNRLNEAFNEKRAVIIVGNCWVDYHGRASSRLEPGERIVIVKEDGAVLVHRSRGYEPVNWQPSGCILQAFKEEDKLVIKAVKRIPHEVVTMFFNKIHFLSTFRLMDEGEFSLYASEEDMQKAILMEPSLIEDGFKPIDYEKRVKPGFIDVYGVDKSGRIVVVEIKRRTAGREAVLQLAKYIETLRRELGREVRGILAAPDISKDARQLLLSLGLDFKRVDPKKCSEVLRRKEERKIVDFF
ncbi:MAG: endonuclease NucS [Candidatus Bathyarchaeia archaeon]|nr:endonuclease NucS [Candidatus Bathyarchaeota archaeon]